MKYTERYRWGRGKVALGPYSSIRKLMRAARRGKMPPEYLRAIEEASSEKALKRHSWYRKKLFWDGYRKLVGQS